jgi:hypothetical protein
VTGPPQRTLVIDENLPKRLATELRYRGRDAQPVSALGLRGSAAPELLRKLDAQLDDWLLVTADDGLPEQHAAAVREVRATVATVHPVREHGWRLDPWRREVAHRWAYVMHDQPTGTVRRYSLRRHVLWRRRFARRPPA